MPENPTNLSGNRFLHNTGPSTIKHSTADYPTADTLKNILSATKKQRTNQLPFVAKFGESSANFGGIPEKKFYSSDIINLADDPPDLVDDPPNLANDPKFFL